jgi:hypothetical protein
MELLKLKELMTFHKNGKNIIPLNVYEINGVYILGVYQGSFSKFDILIKYRQNIKHVWSRIRTPKHIHWAVDMLIKLHEDKIKTQKFLDFLLSIWDKTTPVKSKKQQKGTLSIETLLQNSQSMIRKYDALSEKGEYSIKFLILLAKLLMIQEKTNLETAYMFKSLLKTLREGGNIFSVVSVASHTRR